MGFTVALTIVKSSTFPGKYADYQQFDTIRGLRTAFSNAYEASHLSSTISRVFRGEKGTVLHPSFCPTQSLLFEMFALGLLARMGKDARSNTGLCHKVLLAIIKNVEEDLEAEVLAY